MPSHRQTAQTASRLASRREMLPACFNPRTCAWSPDAAPRTEAAARPGRERLRLVSWNIWFGTHRWRERLDALLAKVARWRPHLVALQEVTPRQLARIVQTDWVRAGFETSDADGASVEPHGVLLLSRIPINRLELVLLPSRRDRKLLVADLDFGEEGFQVLVTHLESGRDQVACREMQLDIAQRNLRGSTPGLIAGDFNFDPDRHPERARIDPALIDCWRALHPRERGDTLDGSANAMRAWMAKSDYAFRSDNILLRPGEWKEPHGWRPASIRRIGLDAIDAGGQPLYPSDHFGLAAEIVATGAASRKRPATST